MLTKSEYHHDIKNKVKIAPDQRVTILPPFILFYFILFHFILFYFTLYQSVKSNMQSRVTILDHVGTHSVARVKKQNNEVILNRFNYEQILDL